MLLLSLNGAVLQTDRVVDSPPPPFQRHFPGSARGGGRYVSRPAIQHSSADSRNCNRFPPPKKPFASGCRRAGRPPVSLSAAPFPGHPTACPPSLVPCVDPRCWGCPGFGGAPTLLDWGVGAARASSGMPQTSSRPRWQTSRPPARGPPCWPSPRLPRSAARRLRPPTRCRRGQASPSEEGQG